MISIKWRVLIAYLSLLRRRYQDHVEQKFSSLKELKELVVVKVDKDMVRDMMSRTHGRMHELLEERFAAVRGAQTPTKREWPLFGMLTQFMLPVRWVCHVRTRNSCLYLSGTVSDSPVSLLAGRDEASGGCGSSNGRL